MKKYLKIIILILILTATALEMYNIYALYKDKLEGEYYSNLGIWKIKINDSDDLTQGIDTTFNITGDYIKYASSNLVAPNVIAPESEACFELLIDATEADVAIKYIVEVGSPDEVVIDEVAGIDVEKTIYGNYAVTTTSIINGVSTSTNSVLLNTKFKAQRIESQFEKDSQVNANIIAETSMISNSNKAIGVIPLNSIEEGYLNKVKVYFKWVNNDDNNESDSVLGLYSENVTSKISIPVKVKLVQYMGETLEE